MRIEKLNSNKVKVTLTGDDLVNYDINVERLSGDSAELHSFLFRIMDTIHKETGFSLYNGQVVVEARTAGDGMTLVISKLLSGKGVTETVKNGRRIIARASERCKGKGVYFFRSFDDLCEAVIQIDNAVHSDSLLYKMNEKYCYLLNFENPYFDNDEQLCSVISILREFAERNASYNGQYKRVTEYGNLIARDKELVAMAENLRKINQN